LWSYRRFGVAYSIEEYVEAKETTRRKQGWKLISCSGSVLSILFELRD
jgi:hypothetical protein